MSKTVKRLFEQFQPNNYQVELELDKEHMTFKGKVVISGKKVGRPAQRLVFHQNRLNITSATLTRHDKKGDEAVTLDRINHHRRYDEVRLHAKRPLYPGHYTVEMKFNGTINNEMHGVYPCYFTHDNIKKTLLATQFESHHAREVFPCIDEPEAKATFDLALLTPKGETVLGNTPVKQQVNRQDVTKTIFETTPKMSVYLLAFVVGDMHSVESKSKSGVTVRSWATTAHNKIHLEYSAKEAADVLDFFEDYFGVPYPMQKLDQVALPDFDSGAMENWGLVTYRETALLADPINRSITSEQLVSLVISHELSHQWFGNLVTMKWWDDLWLNESFAGLMEHVATDELHPDWNQWELYALSDIALITSRDSYKDIQPVAVDVDDPDLISTLFDPAIVYAKGARLLKMLREYIGDKVFVTGLKQYFKEHAYGNATRQDLWDALSLASGKDIATLMTPWLTQAGMPVLHVTQNGKDVGLTQERFLLDGQPDGSIWPIPLLSVPELQPMILTSKSAVATLPVKDYVLCNHTASGQYITHYTEKAHREAHAKALQKLSVTTETRINLLNDMYMLTRSGTAPITDILDVIIHCSKEPRDGVWGLMIRAINAAGQLTEGDKAAEQNIRKLKVRLAADWYEKLGWSDSPNDDPNTKQLRHTMAGLMVSGDDPQAMKQAVGIYNKAESLQSIPAEIRNTVLAAVVKTEDTATAMKLLGHYESADPDLQLDISQALAATRDSALASEILSAGLGEKGFVRPQDVLRWLVLFLRNPYTRSAAWDYMTSNWEWFEKTLTNSKSFDFLPSYTASIISTEAWAKKYRDLFDSKQHIKVLRRNIGLGLADIESRVAWRKRDEALIKAWLAKQIAD